METKKLRATILERVMLLPLHYQKMFNRRWCPNNDITVPISETIRTLRASRLSDAIVTIEIFEKQFATSVLNK